MKNSDYILLVTKDTRICLLKVAELSMLSSLTPAKLFTLPSLSAVKDKPKELSIITISAQHLTDLVISLVPRYNEQKVELTNSVSKILGSYSIEKLNDKRNSGILDRLVKSMQEQIDKPETEEQERSGYPIQAVQMSRRLRVRFIAVCKQAINADTLPTRRKHLAKLDNQLDFVEKEVHELAMKRLLNDSLNYMFKTTRDKFMAKATIAYNSYTKRFSNSSHPKPLSESEMQQIALALQKANIDQELFNTLAHFNNEFKEYTKE